MIRLLYFLVCYIDPHRQEVMQLTLRRDSPLVSKPFNLFAINIDLGVWPFGTIGLCMRKRPALFAMINHKQGVIVFKR